MAIGVAANYGEFGFGLVLGRDVATGNARDDWNDDVDRWWVSLTVSGAGILSPLGKSKN